MRKKGGFFQKTTANVLHLTAFIAIMGATHKNRRFQNETRDRSTVHMLKKVRIRIKAERHRLMGSIFEPTEDSALMQELPPSGDEPETIEMMMEGSYHDDGTRISISYREGELSGMENCKTTLHFQKNDPALISMVRDGTVRTALIFEAGKRHICIYQTPLMPFEVAVQTAHVCNTVEENSRLSLDYTVEIKGAEPERTRFCLELLPYLNKPLSAN